MKANSSSIKEGMLENLSINAAQVQSIEGFKDWTRKSIRPIFPHEILACGYGHMHAAGIAMDGIVSVDYPFEHLAKIRNKAGGIDGPILRRWLSVREPQLFDGDSPWPDTPKNWLDHFQANAFKNIAAHGVYDITRCIGTYFNFIRIPGSLGDDHVETMKWLVPVMHEVLCRAVSKTENQNYFPFSSLSTREQEVLRMVSDGKTNAEIAKALFVSEVTIKHHVASIFKKSGVDNRTQLVRRYVEYEMSLQSGRGPKLL